ncbi:MAG: flavin reductase family protein [Pseudomonadota bacterium]
MPDSTVKPHAAPAEAYRCALGQFPTGVCLVSARGLDADPDPFAITVSSFVSVSLEPPLVSWCLQHDSSSFPLWAATERFAISVLTAHQQHLCDHFAQRGNHIIGDLPHFVTSPEGNPWVRNACANFDAEVSARFDAGDHEIIVAKVCHFESNPDRSPLIYHQGRVRASS